MKPRETQPLGMAMTNYFISLEASAVFSGEKAAKVDVALGTGLFVGLNCFEAGQSQPVHVHAGSDKFYLVLSGKARIVVADDEREVGPGTLVWAPANVPHGISRALERTVLMVAMAPPPAIPSPRR